jgi:adenylosuccinate synthase
VTSITVVAGAQFGSEGKGAITGFLSRDLGENSTVIRVAGPNAGHTVYDSAGRVFKLRAVPVAAATSATCQLHIAAGSEIDIDVLMSEIMRRADTISAVPSLRHLMSEPGAFNLADQGHVIIEGTQGYGLGLHTKYYPQVTSSDCRAIDFLSMAGVSPWADEVVNFRVVLVARVYPIRVAGNSGPLQNETTWAELGLPEEYTTVTHKVRRVGTWDPQLVAEAVIANGGGNYHPNIEMAITMVDQLFPKQANRIDLDDEVLTYLDELEEQIGANVSYVGTGPTTVAAL